jgi:hypothetical protein
VKSAQSIEAMAGKADITPQLAKLQDDLADLGARLLSTTINTQSGEEVIPICKSALPLSSTNNQVFHSYSGAVIAVALEELPVPNDECSWQEIIEFKEALRDKQWGFRRFLNALATKRQIEAEIRDEIEWTVNEYAKEMDRFKMKRSVGFMEAYIIPTVEALESFRPSSFLKGLVSIKKRRIELLEAEAKAPGRECAYVFDARKRFAKSS